jgi:aryl-alcohol dehydrogenase-like predicted oxidoreductase
MAQLPQRRLGKDGPLVSALGFGKSSRVCNCAQNYLQSTIGAMGLSASYGTVGDNEERFKVLDKALELGSTFWDTSDVCQSPQTYPALLLVPQS